MLRSPPDPDDDGGGAGRGAGVASQQHSMSHSSSSATPSRGKRRHGRNSKINTIPSWSKAGVLVASVLIANPILGGVGPNGFGVTPGGGVMAYPHRHPSGNLAAQPTARPWDVKGAALNERDTAEEEKPASAWTREEKGKARAIFEGEDQQRGKRSFTNDLYPYGLHYVEDPLSSSITAKYKEGYHREALPSTSSTAAVAIAGMTDAPASATTPLIPYGGLPINIATTTTAISTATSTATATATRTFLGGAASLYTSVPSSWEPPERSIWFQKKTIIIVSIFLAIFIVLFIGAAVFLRDRRYDLGEDETDEEAIQRILRGRREEQDRVKKRSDARSAAGEDQGAAGGPAGPADEGGDAEKEVRTAEKAKTRHVKRPVTRWIKATAMAPVTAYAYMRYGSKRDAAAEECKDEQDTARTSSSSSSRRRRNRSSTSLADPSSGSPSSPRRSTASDRHASTDDRRSIRSTSASVSSGNLPSGLRQRRDGGRRPRLGDGRSTERIEIQYDLPPSSAPPSPTAEPSSTGAPAERGRLDASDLSAADVELAAQQAQPHASGSTRLDAGAPPPGSAAIAPTVTSTAHAEDEEAFPPAYLPTRNIQAGRETSLAALAAAATTEQKTDAAIAASSRDIQGGQDGTQEVARAVLAQVQGAGGVIGSASEPGATEEDAVANRMQLHIATDDKSVLQALSAAESAPTTAAHALPGAPPAIAGSTISAAASQPTAPALEVDEDGFEQFATDEAQAQAQQTSSLSTSAGKGKAPSLLPPPPPIAAPRSFSPFDQPYSPLWPPRAAQYESNPSSPAPTPAPSAPPASAPTSADSTATAAAQEKEEEARKERVLLASSPADFATDAAGRGEGLTLPAYQSVEEGQAAAPAVVPSAPPVHELEHTSGTAPPAELLLPEDQEEEDRQGDGQGAEHRLDADGCPEI